MPGREFESVDGVKLSLINAAGIIQSAEAPERTKRWGEGGTCSSCLSWDIHLLPLGIGTPGAQAFGLRQEFTPLASLVLVFELGWTYTTTILGF